MSQLRESVIVKTATIDLQGELFVGEDGLPKLEVTLSHHRTETYRPATLPAAWTVKTGELPFGPLFQAWWDIWQCLEDIKNAQRGAEADDRDRAQQREIDARTAQEIDERRADE